MAKTDNFQPPSWLPREHLFYEDSFKSFIGSISDNIENMNNSLLEQTQIIEDWISEMENNNKNFADFHKQVTP